MRISDWSSDVCSPDLPASSSVPALTSTARGSAYTSSRCRTDTDHCAQPSAHHQSQHPADWQEAAHPDPDPRPATPHHNPNGDSEHFPELGPQVPPPPPARPTEYAPSATPGPYHSQSEQHNPRTTKTHQPSNPGSHT